MKNQLKNILMTALLTVTAAGLSSCAGAGAGGGDMKSTTAAATKEGVKPYPLKTCIVTDNDLGSMGDEKRIVYQGQEIKFCCAPCEGKFLKNPEKYLSKLK